MATIVRDRAKASHFFIIKKMGQTTKAICQTIPITTLNMSLPNIRLGKKVGASFWTSTKTGFQKPQGLTFL